MKFFIALLITLSSYSVLANQPEEIATTRINACTFWSYNVNARGYVCNSTFPVEVADRYDINALQNELMTLKARVRQLETEAGN